jgi:putative nucleotidyltransferase with HDIG domain
MLDLVRALVSSIDAKDPYTCGHSERVAITCREVARRMNLSDREVECAYMAGLLHDIGKIGTPEHILRKEGRLEPEERQIVQRHPVIGGHILEGIKRMEPIREAILHHHERLDGSGYPDGLRGDQVPLLARVVGLADAFDAMTSNRPYRPMLPFEHVKHEIERNVGTQFDVRAVDALFSLDMNRLMHQFAERATTCTASA